jgi:phospholipase C
MLENRSFDNMLGYLYEPGAAPRAQGFEGVAGRNLAGAIPAGADGAARGPLAVYPQTVMDDPKPDPGEEYPHVNTQLYGTVDPASNADKAALQMTAPFNAPARPHEPAPMDGFVQDYINNFTNLNRRAPTYDEYRVIMGCFPPDAVPVISTLAREFAVCDHWHCEVPSQTFCNRSFFHAATSSGFVTNEPYPQFPEHNTAETLFDRLDRHGVSWRVYFDPQDFVSLTALIHFRRLWSRFRSNIVHVDQFFADARDGRLPQYAFVEPRLLFNHNDEHPPSTFLGQEQDSSVLAGEILVAQVYDAIRTSDSAHGSNWRNTAFLLTYDEHGGCFDHVSPPPAPPPEARAPAGEMDFRFDRLGVRVPAVLISAYTAAGTIVSSPLRHTAVIKTLSEKWGLGHLTERDRTAPDLGPLFNLAQPRPASEWPTVTARPFTPPASYAAQPLNELQRALIATADAAVGSASLVATDVRTVGDALSFLARKFGNPL